jgi:predicted DNA-binding antitoxin AbrB/MazE fold protein
MSKAVEATYEKSTLRLDDPLPLDEHQRVRVIVLPDWQAEPSAGDRPTPEEILRIAAQVYEGLAPDDIREIEGIALDRSHFFPADREQ